MFPNSKDERRTDMFSENGIKNEKRKEIVENECISEMDDEIVGSVKPIPDVGKELLFYSS